MSLHLSNCSIELTDFLSNLDENIYELVKPSTKNILQNPEILDIYNSIVLYGNDNIYLEAFFKALLKKNNPNVNMLLKSAEYEYKEHNKTNTVDYKYNNVYYELNYTDNHIKFIISIINNKHINGAKHIFLLKNFEVSSQPAIKRILDKCNHVQFFIMSKNMKSIHNTLLSRSFLINIAFPMENMIKFTGGKTVTNTLVSTIAGIDGKIRVEVMLDDVLTKLTKSKNEYEIIMTIRDYCYKIYHMCIPFDFIAKYVINKYTTHKKIREIVHAAAECDYLLTIGSKDIILFETFFLKLYKIL